jgi:hypothetical protein
MKKPEWAKEDEYQDFLHEAEVLIEGKEAKK